MENQVYRLGMINSSCDLIYICFLSYINNLAFE
jgi:hypothetical protein